MPQSVFVKTKRLRHAAVALVAILSFQAFAQSSAPMPPMASDAHPAFDVATIKPSTANEPSGNFRIGGHRIYVENQTVNALIAFAYAVHPQQIVDGPSWLDTQRYDIVGQADIDGAPNLTQVQEMLRNLLEDRFKLTLRREQRDLNIYALVIAKGGPKLAPSGIPSGLPYQTGGHLPGGQSKKFTNNSMSDFALGMQSFVSRPIVDRTGLTGRFNFILHWTSDEESTTQPATVPSLFTAIQEQLGLKLEPTKGYVEVLVIQRVAFPSEN